MKAHYGTQMLSNGYNKLSTWQINTILKPDRESGAGNWMERSRKLGSESMLCEEVTRAQGS